MPVYRMYLNVKANKLQTIDTFEEQKEKYRTDST